MEQEITLDLMEIFQIIKKRIWLIIVITFISSAIGGVYSFLIAKPSYEASTSIYMGKMPEGENQEIYYSDVLMYQQLVKTYGEIAKSIVVAENTSSKLNNTIAPDVLLNNITVTPGTDTQIMDIKYKNNNQQETANIANTYAQCFIDEAMRLYPNGNIQVMDPASEPKGPVSPRKKLNIAIAFLLGLMVSMGIIFLAEYMDSTIKTEEDVDKLLELPVIGIIPRNMEN